MRIAIVDDDSCLLDKVEAYIDTYFGHQSDRYQISRFTDGKDFLTFCHSAFDIIFLDIQLGNTDGFKIAQRIRPQDEHVILILMTSLAKYAVRGYEVDALSFMVKPFGYGQFALTMKKAETSLDRYSRGSLMLNMDGDVKIVRICDIYYIEVFDHWLVYYLENESYRTRGSIRKLQEQLSGECFALCNRCYLVNLHYVRDVKGEELSLGRYTLKIGRTRKREFLAALVDYIGGSY